MSNTLGLIGRKMKMLQYFDEQGTLVVVTAIEIQPSYVTQVRTEDRDGYLALQVGYDKVPLDRLSKPMQGHFRKAGFDCGFKNTKEFRIESPEEVLECGSELSVSLFAVGDKVTISGISKGKGTQGVMRRWNFSGLPATHGNEKTPRSGGSIGNNTFPGKVFKGKKMAGRMGNERITVKNVPIMNIIDNIVLVKGPVPGAANTLITLYKQ